MKYAVVGSGTSHGTGHFDIVEVASPMGLAIFKACRHRLNQLAMGSGKSYGTCHFKNVSTQPESVSYGEWPVPWDCPFSKRVDTG